MNIFFLHQRPIAAAYQLCDKHCVKMLVETAQLLSTAHRVLDGKPHEIVRNGRKKTVYLLGNDLDNKLLQATHINHPCAVWVRQSVENYQWLAEYFTYMLQSYTERYKKIHAYDPLKDYLLWEPTNIPQTEFTVPAACVGDIPKPAGELTVAQVIDLYKQFYIKDKAAFAVWKFSPVPTWWPFNVDKTGKKE